MKRTKSSGLFLIINSGIVAVFLIIAFIIFIATFKPVLTFEMADKVVYYGNLFSKAPGVISAGWEGSLRKLACIMYIIYSASCIFFSLTLPRKPFVNLISAVCGALLGFTGLMAVYECRFLLIYLSVILLAAGFILSGTKKPIKVLYLIPGGVLIVLLLVFTIVLSRSHTPAAPEFKSVSLFPNRKFSDARDTYGPINEFLGDANISHVYSEKPLANLFTVMSGTDITVSVGEIASIDDASAPLYVIWDEETANATDEMYIKYGENLFSSGEAFVYSYKNINYLNNVSFLSDMDLLTEEGYDSFFITTKDNSKFDPSIFLNLRGTKTLFLSTDSGNVSAVNDLVSLAAGRTEEDTAFLLIDPETFMANKATDLDALCATIAGKEGTFFQIMLGIPSLSYWKKKGSDLTDLALEKYLDTARLLCALPNVHLYSPVSAEWVIANPDNYVSDKSFTGYLADKLTAVCYCDELYMADEGVIADYALQLKELIAKERNYPDLSDKEIVFVGDSIFGYSHGSVSIPGVVGGLTGAEVFNMGYGGAPAQGDSSASKMCFMGVNDYLLDGADTSDITYDGLADEVENLRKNLNGNEQIFFIQFGLNDYFNGQTVAGYKEALIRETNRIKEKYPDAIYIIMSPTFTGEYTCGTEINSPVGSVLDDYRGASKEAAEELNAYWLNSIELFDKINESTFTKYLGDWTHPYFEGRFYTGERMVEYLSEILK